MNEANTDKTVNVTKRRLPSIVGSLTRTLSVGLFVVFVTMTVLINLYGNNLLQNITNERLNYIVSTQASNVAQLLYDFEIDTIEDTLENIVADKNINAAQIVEIFDVNESIVAEYNWDEVDEGSIILQDKIIIENGGVDRRELGMLRVSVDYNNIRQHLHTIMLVSGGLFGVIFIIFGMLVYYTLRSGIYPITKLSDSLVGADYATHKIEKTSSSSREIHDLLDALITMQKIMQRQTCEIHDQKIMLDTIIEKMPLGMLVEDINNDSSLIIVNGMFKMLFGLTLIDCEGKRVKDILPAEDAEFLDALNSTLFEKKKLVEIGTYKTNSPGGSFVAHVLKTPILDENQNVTYVLSMVEDVTEQVESKEKLLQAKNLAEKANRAKSEFLANMSHELRTPMNSIIGLTNIMFEDKDTTAEQKENLDTIHKSSNNLLNIVNDILDLSKIEAGGMHLENIPFDLKDSVSTVVDTLRPLASAKSLTVTTEWKGKGLPVVLGDPTRFSRIIMNLGSNAIKFTENGGVDLTFEVIEKSENVISFVCKVIDTGVGIPNDKIKHIFEKFSQADDSITRKFGGTGLGLAITKQLIEMMGGQINVKSVFGKGSTFTVEIPFDLSSRELLEGLDKNIIDDDADKDAGSRKAISDAVVLVAEDQKMNQIFIKKLLCKIGIQYFDIADDGQIAVDMFDKKDYDLVIMDCHMPNMTGYDATKEIRNHAKGGEVPIVAMTADAMVGTREECIAAGMTDYIPKPVDSKKFQKMLQRWFILKPAE
ncbi:MAG: response regulator [Micavibrio sp.]|nr:response regulator [Micavibrio sp.]